MEKIAAVFERLAVGALVLLHTRELVAEPRVLFDIFGLFVAVLVALLIAVLVEVIVAVFVAVLVSVTVAV